MPNKRPVDKKSSVPDRFPAHFDKEVTPRLAELIRWSGNLVACEAYLFSEVFDLVWHEAWRLGAGFLPGDVQDELQDWIATELGQSIAGEPPAGALSPRAALSLWESLRHVTQGPDTGDSNGQ